MRSSGDAHVPAGYIWRALSGSHGTFRFPSHLYQITAIYLDTNGFSKPFASSDNSELDAVQQQLRVVGASAIQNSG